MSKLNSLQIGFEPMGFGFGGTQYKITVVVDGLKHSNSVTVVEPLPHESEIEMLIRMYERLKRSLEEAEQNNDV